MGEIYRRHSGIREKEEGICIVHEAVAVSRAVSFFRSQSITANSPAPAAEAGANAEKNGAALMSRPHVVDPPHAPAHLAGLVNR